MKSFYFALILLASQSVFAKNLTPEQKSVIELREQWTDALKSTMSTCQGLPIKEEQVGKDLDMAIISILEPHRKEEATRLMIEHQNTVKQIKDCMEIYSKIIRAENGSSVELDVQCYPLPENQAALQDQARDIALQLLNNPNDERLYTQNLIDRGLNAKDMQRCLDTYAIKAERLVREGTARVYKEHKIKSL